MRFRGALALALILLALGCTISGSRTIVLKTNVNPAQVSLDRKRPVAIEASVENIGNGTIKVTVEAEDTTEGLVVKSPPRTTFTLKPGESRVLVFDASLEETSPPGKYRIDVVARTERGEMVRETTFLRVVSQQGFL